MFPIADTINSNVWRLIQNGNRELAAYFVEILERNEGYGFNFLHKQGTYCKGHFRNKVT
jgi:hypothetical protein